ncbi:MAG TPA: helix-turn-helix transcriptional regulator [Anaerolineae bacterium]|nr:helix-turn-helix transcriptional regulator [Anaerolineae bacterium]
MEAAQTIAIRNKIVGILVKRARGKAGKSQRDCAELLGCSPSQFGQYEQGKRGLSLPQLETLAYSLETPLASLWDDGYDHPQELEDESLPLLQIMDLRRKMLAVKFRQCRQTAGMSQREMSQLLGCSTYAVSQYERGARDIPLAELEIAAEHCGYSLADFVDEQTLPLSRAEQQRQMLVHLEELPPDVRDFVLKPTNALYLRIAMLLSAMKADDLRHIAETLLDITY